MPAGAAERTLEPDEVAELLRTAPVVDGGAVVVARGRHDGERIVRKTATGRARERLRREAELLEHLVLPERIELVEVVDLEDDLDDPSGTTRTVMVTRDAGTTTLADTAQVRDDEIVRALRRTGEALVRLHESGWCHGAVTPEHVVVGTRGRIRLCSFGSAHPVDPADPTATAGDLSAFLGIVDLVGRRPSSATSWRQRRRWRAAARSLRRAVATARAAQEPPSTTLQDVVRVLSQLQLRGAPAARHRLPATGLALVAAGLVVLGLVLRAGSDPETRPDSGPAATASTAVTPFAPFTTLTIGGTGSRDVCADGDGALDVDGDGCAEVVAVAGHVVSIEDRSYRLGVPGDLAAVGDWDCDGVATARLVRPTTGEVFEFPTWAADRAPAEGTLITTVPAPLPPHSVRTAPGGPSGSCDRLLVAPGDGDELAVGPEEALP